jgi:hypothetical protein
MTAYFYNRPSSRTKEETPTFGLYKKCSCYGFIARRRRVVHIKNKLKKRCRVIEKNNERGFLKNFIIFCHSHLGDIKVVHVGKISLNIYLLFE